MSDLDGFILIIGCNLRQSRFNFCWFIIYDKIRNSILNVIFTNIRNRLFKIFKANFLYLISTDFIGIYRIRCCEFRSNWATRCC
uniref:Uncharacterized protein n=1 Tax=Lepeophtheirus salmonis TaxID=72036 RepID=A0A0K2T9Y8_LEPSM